MTPEDFLAPVRKHLADHSLAAAYQQGVKDPGFAEIVRERATAGGLDAGKIEVGVGVEIEKWDINNDLLKFWRSYTRGQIASA